MDKKVEKQLKSLFKLQKVDSEIDEVRKLRGELPIEVADLEDEIEGLETRMGKFEDELDDYKRQITDRETAIKDSEKLKAKYETQLNNIKNSREYDALTKEIEMQGLEIQLSNKKIKEFNAKSEFKQKDIDEILEKLNNRRKDLEIKKAELDDIVAENKEQEEGLKEVREKASKNIEDRLLKAYKRIRRSSRNGLAVVKVERNSCGGCFNKIPPQRQLDIKARKKILICEHCGRVLVDPEIDKRKSRSDKKEEKTK